MNTFFIIINILLLILYCIWVFVLIRQNILLKRQNNDLIHNYTNPLVVMNHIIKSSTIELLEEMIEIKKKEQK